MKKLISTFVGCLVAQAAFASDPALTIYNQNFAVVRDSIHLSLKAGVNDVSYNEATMHLEPDSVVLRDPTGQRALQILEQNFRADPISQALLLNYYEGKTIEFQTQPEGAQGKKEFIHGKIVRSGYVPHQQAFNQYGQEYYQSQMAYASPNSGGGQPIIEVNGKLMFSLPGEPLFPTLPDDSILKPTLTWQLNADRSGALDAELSYITGGMSWQAAYNLVAPEKGDALDLAGWVTIDNQTGKSFQHAKIKLMAGDVNKIQPQTYNRAFGGMMLDALAPGQPPVTEKAFDEYHLYTLERATTLLDRETKQVEFVRADGIQSRPIYVYDGASIDRNRYNGWDPESIRNDRDYGTQSNPKVWVMREFMNSESNHLGIPLPKGRLRFYRRDADGQMEFTGENTIDHTPRNEMVRVTTGNAFDVVGERQRTNHHLDNGRKFLDESFAIKLRNHKKEAVEIRVVEHLYRWPSWDITEKSQTFAKTDAQTIEFRVEVKPDAEENVTYTVHYSW
ncbi:MAG: DUF4139 domain-containing protein [Verrucomicrobiota bacterium]|jgi:hypothetical protein